MKIWVAYLIPKEDFIPVFYDGIGFMAASDVGEDEAEAVLLRDIKHDYGEQDVLEIYKAHRLHVRELILPISMNKE